ncbi:MAG: hypothetical protein PXX83_07310 [Candidatus Nitrosotalea sp.]|nr:hypothetical protein [Candidatus Nitrosotalea sp.]
MEHHHTGGCGSMSSHEYCGCAPMAFHGQCGCGSGHDSSHMSKMYKHAFFEAMHQAKVEHIKKRIEATMGPTLDKTAEAIVDSFGKIWQSKMQDAEVMKDLESKLKRIISETHKD